jgi:hypothetical protein
MIYPAKSSSSSLLLELKITRDDKTREQWGVKSLAFVFCCYYRKASHRGRRRNGFLFILYLLRLSPWSYLSFFFYPTRSSSELSISPDAESQLEYKNCHSLYTVIVVYILKLFLFLAFVWIEREIICTTM